MSNLYNSFTKKYSLSKTLKFELKPQGKTLENIYKNKIIEIDERKALDYKKAKKIIDKYHQYFIEKVLSSLHIPTNLLEEYSESYFKLKKNNDLETEKFFEIRKGNIYKFIHKHINSSSEFKNLFKKELIEKDLINYLNDCKSNNVSLFENFNEIKDIDEAKQIIENFQGWTSYFIGFNENRKNIYSKDEIPTSIIYRIVSDNLPKFLDNQKKYYDIKDKFPSSIDEQRILLDLDNEATFKINYITGECKEKTFTLDEIFSLENFNNYLNQSGITKFNTIIGGKFIDGEKTKRKGVNEYLNLYSQQTKDKTVKKYKMTVLFKQILSDVTSTSFVIDSLNDDRDVVNAISGFYSELENFKTIENKNIQETINDLFINLENEKFDLSKIYLKNDKLIKNISKQVFKDFSIIDKAILKQAIKQVSPKKIDNITATEQKKIDKISKDIKYIDLQTIKNALADFVINDKEYKFTDLLSYFLNISNQFNEIKKKTEELDTTLNKYNNVIKKDLLYSNAKLDVAKIKELLDLTNKLFNNLKLFNINDSKNVLDKDELFYLIFENSFIQLSNITKLYNKIRNYITKKPYNNDKFKLNFKNTTLAKGWDKNKESDNTSILFLKDDKYYLGIMDKKHNRIFNDQNISKNISNGYKKVVYKLLPGANKMLPKVFFSNKGLDFYNPSEDILRIRNHSTHTKSGTPQKGFEKLEFNLSDCRKMIDFYKNSIEKHSEWVNFEFNFSDTNEYTSIDQFYREVENQGYKLTFIDISEKYINSLINDGKLYLFQLYNKDFSKYSKGRPNLHTLYWKSLFSEENLKDVVYKLNGEAELFFRRKSIPKKITHPANEPIDNKNILTAKNQSIFDYDLIKDKRFTEDKFFFHCPITINFKANNITKFNEQINTLLQQKNDNVHILSIDRGERHLAYYTLLNRNGDIIKQDSFNIVENEKSKVDYHSKLNEIEKNRASSRESWQEINNIKEMKEGYLSHIIHKIAKMAIEYNAIIVFEDLNFGFKTGRFKIEKQVYQKLEKMLIEKLNLLVFKDNNINNAGGILNGYQLTEPFKTFKDMGKQTGIIYYVGARFTSKICPITGFVNRLYPKYESISKAKEFFNKFKSIKFNSEKGYFEFTFDYKDFGNKAIKGTWTVTSFGTRLINFINKEKNNNWDTVELSPTKLLQAIFSKNYIDYGHNECIKKEICNESDKLFFTKLINCLKYMLQMRNSKVGTDIDYLISPIADKNGNFFDSRKVLNNSLPKDADANGAYHIGLKGLMILDRIKNKPQDKKLDLLIKDVDYFDFVKNRNN